MDPLDAAITETDIPRVRQIVLDDLRNAERTLAGVSAAGRTPNVRDIYARSAQPSPSWRS
jgi:hypothetical protein